MNPINKSTHPTVFLWQPAAWLRVSGADAANFLQGQFSADLRRARPERAVYGLWLNVKGKVLADSFIAPSASDRSAFWVGSYFCTAAVIRERLESFVIADDVVVEDLTANWSACSVFASGLPEAREQPTDIVFAGRRGEEAIEWIFPAERKAAVAEALAAAPRIDAAEMERRRIRAGIPAVPADAGPGDLPNEAGLELDAISYDKGCYLGQEVMARLKSMGQVRRRLVRVRAEAMSEPPQLPAALFVGERRVGELRSAVRDGDGVIGLAMVSLLHVTADSELAFVPGGRRKFSLTADYANSAGRKLGQKFGAGLPGPNL